MYGALKKKEEKKGKEKEKKMYGAKKTRGHGVSIPTFEEQLAVQFILSI